MRGVLHTTEGSTLAGALATYRRTEDYPHFTLDSVTIEQHVPINVAATALKNTNGGVETNKQGAIQIEIVGFAASAPLLPEPLLLNLRQLMIWIEQQTGIKPVAPAFKAYPGSYGADNGIRMNSAQWRSFNGWAGHEHCPENLHGDPGLINIEFLLKRGANALQDFDLEDDDMPKPNDIVSRYRWPNGREVKLQRDGAVLCYGVPSYGSMFSLRPEEKLSFVEGGSIAPVDVQNPAAGYIVYAQDASAYQFDPAFAESRKGR